MIKYYFLTLEILCFVYVYVSVYNFRTELTLKK